MLPPNAGAFQHIKRMVIPSQCAHSSALRAGFRRLRYAHACGRSGLGDPPLNAAFSTLKTQVFLKSGRSPHQSADWFAMTLFFLLVFCRAVVYHGYRRSPPGDNLGFEMQDRQKRLTQHGENQVLPDRAPLLCKGSLGAPAPVHQIPFGLLVSIQHSESEVSSCASSTIPSM